MNTIIKKDQLSGDVCLMEVLAPHIAEESLAGQFIILQIDEEFGERIPLTIAKRDVSAGSITLVFQTVGATTHKLAERQVGDRIAGVLGPLGKPSRIAHVGRVLAVGGGIGAAPLYPIVQAHKAVGNHVTVILGARTRELVIFESEMRAVADEVIVCTDDGSYGRKALVTIPLQELCASVQPPDEVVAIGPPIMMKFCAETTRPFGIPTVVSLNTIMVDGTGMCGGCRVTVGGETKFVCVDGPEFDAHLVDFDNMMKRMKAYKKTEAKAHASYHAADVCKLGPRLWKSGAVGMKTKSDLNAEAEKILVGLEAKGALTIKDRVAIPQQDMPTQLPAVRVTNTSEVALGYTAAMARVEALRCLQCVNQPCVAGCPVSIDIPRFIQAITEQRDTDAIAVIKEASLLPSVCGRVCPQESQCMLNCTLGKIHNDVLKGVAIGRLERYVADQERECGQKVAPSIKPSTGHKVAVIGGGPAAITFAVDVRREGHAVTLFEALHKPGGVLMYGIPEFRLPKAIVEAEIELLREMGVEIRTNFVVGRSRPLKKLIEKEGYSAMFIGTGAGLPKFMDIPGENLVGVFSANEYLTRANLMKAYDTARADTPIARGRRVAVFGGGNVAMDAARTARRLGAEHVYLVYRRTEAEMPARVEEAHHAKEEGVEFRLLQNAVGILGNEQDEVTGITCVRYNLGAPDASGRRRPVAIPGSEFVLAVDSVIVAIGNESNPLISATTPEIAVDLTGRIIVNDKNETSLGRVYAGGDIVLGAATVILAMGEGRRAATAVNARLAGMQL